MSARRIGHLPLNDNGLRSEVIWGIGVDFILN